MHIRLYFVCFLFVFSSCSNNQVSVKNEKEGKLNSTYQLMVSDEKKIALDSETPTRPPYMQIYTDSTGNRLLTFLNSSSITQSLGRAIYICDINMNTIY